MSIQERRVLPEPTGAARTADRNLAEPDLLHGTYRDHHGAVTAAARSVCGPLLAVDVAQEVFVTLWRHPDKFDPDRGSLRAFLTAMARHKAVDALRSDTARRARELRFDAGQRPVPGLDDRLLRREDADQIREAVAGLPAGERDAFVATFYGDRTYREAAAWLGQPEGTVKSRIRSGLRRLRPILADLGVDPGRIDPAASADGDADWVEAPPRWFAPPSPAELALLALAVGPVLDIGCGPGRHVLALNRAGVDAVGIDVSSQFVGIARRRGAPVHEGSIFDDVPSTGEWETCLLMDGNIGIGACPEAMLSRAGGLLRPGGRLLIEASPAGTPQRRRTLRLAIDGAPGPGFVWADVGIDRLLGLAGDIGLIVHRAWCAERRWFAWLGT